MKNIKKNLVISSLGLMSLAFSPFANAQYSLCSQSQIDNAKKLLNISVESGDRYHSCLITDEKKQSLLFANSNVIASEENDEVETYDLTTYLIDGKNNRLISHNKLDDNIISDAFTFEEVLFDTTPFSTLEDKTIVGLLLHHSSVGGVTRSTYDLQLFNIANNKVLPIGTILVSAVNHVNGIGFANSEVKTILILSKNITNGLQNITLKTTKTNRSIDCKTCKEVTEKWREKSTVKFDGKQYQFKIGKLEPDGM